jgi:hypothetical protein
MTLLFYFFSQHYIVHVAALHLLQSSHSQHCSNQSKHKRKPSQKYLLFWYRPFFISYHLITSKLVTIVLMERKRRWGNGVTDRTWLFYYSFCIYFFFNTFCLHFLLQFFSRYGFFMLSFNYWWPLLFIFKF